MAKITIQSIAKELGLSRNTVSMALRGSELVAPRTRDMVMRYAAQTGYAAPKEQEERPAKAQEHKIMILRKPDVAVYWDKVINGISEEASRNHCRTQVAVVSQEDEDRLKLPLGLNESVRAVFCVKMMSREYVRKIRQMGICIFQLDTYTDIGGEIFGDVVKTESFHSVVELTRHLISQGMRRIGFLNEGGSLYETMHDRLDGYLYAMERAGIKPEPELVIPDMRDYEIATFENIVDSCRNMPEAVVCGNDEIAKFLTQTLRGRGIRVPQDVAVTGFDNDEEGMLDPFFTTVNVDAKWLGRRLVQCFLWRLEHPEAPYEKVEVAGKVVLRKSSVKQAAAAKPA